MTENIVTILHIIQHIKQLNPNVYIVWDPILKASAGFDFQHQISPNTLRLICENIYLITPNIEEFDLIFDRDLPQNIVKKYGCNVLLKGGHAKGQVVVDTLFTHQNKCHAKQSRSKRDKHGTGCVLSTTILTYLARGKSLSDACRAAQDYVVRFINSNDSLLGYHDYTAAKEAEP